MGWRSVFFTADVQAPERLPNTVFADAKALGSFGQVGIGVLVHVVGERLHINLGSRLVAAGARLRLLLPAKQGSDGHIEQRAGLLERQAFFLFVGKHVLAEAYWVRHGVI